MAQKILWPLETYPYPHWRTPRFQKNCNHPIVCSAVCIHVAWDDKYLWKMTFAAVKMIFTTARIWAFEDTEMRQVRLASSCFYSSLQRHTPQLLHNNNAKPSWVINFTLFYHFRHNSIKFKSPHNYYLCSSIVAF